MNFLFPAFLAALAAIAIPIIIHLFYFRRFKTVYFSNVKFLREIKEEKASRNKLKHLLVLLARILAIACLVFAFAQPFIQKDENSKVVQGSKAVSVYIDNSFSMDAKSEDVSLFEKARYKAREIAQAYGPEDRFQLLTNDFEGKHQRLLLKDEFLAQLDEVSVSPNTQKLEDVVNRQKQALENSDAKQKNCYLISDFQKNIADFENDTLYKYYLVPLQSVQQQNVFIDSVWFEQPVLMLNETNKLLVRVVNTGESEIKGSRLSLLINNNAKSLKDLNIPAKTTLTDTLTFAITESGWNKCEVNVIDEPITFDDTYYFSFEIASQVGILGVFGTQASPYLRALMRQSTDFNYQEQAIGQLDYAKLPANQLIVLSGIREIPTGLADVLRKYIEGGGSLVIFPDAQINKDNYNNFLRGLSVNTYTSLNNNRREVGSINIEQEVFKNVFERNPTDNANTDLPFAATSWDMSAYSNTGEEVLISFKDGGSMFSKYNVGAGKVYLAAVPLDNKTSNLPSHAVFVPLIHKIAVVSTRTGRLAYTIGNDNTIEANTKITDKESVFKLKGEKKEFIPGQKVVGAKAILSLNNQIKEAGHYDLEMEAGKPLADLAFNYNRQESILEYLNMSDLKEKYKYPNIQILESNYDLTHTVATIDRGMPLWKWCLILALAFLTIEILLLRLWR